MLVSRAWIVGLVLALSVLPQAAVAQTFIEKVENKALKGAAYARVRDLTYQQCERRCLEDARCVAIEHYRGGGVLRRSSNCALFSSIEKSGDSKYSDIGFKRRSVAAAPGTVAPKPSPRAGGAAPRPEGDTARRYQPPAAATAPQARARVQDQATREPAFEARRHSEAPAASPPPPPKVTSIPPSASRSVRGPSAAPPAGGAAPSIPRASPPTETTSPMAESSSRNIQPGPSDRFHIVPVFYGTDRNRVKQEGRIGYANDRAKRLEMGRALVSVPLDHKVPNIERPRAWTIPYLGTIQLEKEDPNKHFTVREIKVLTKADLLALVRQRLGDSRTYRDQAIVFVHGYNMSFDDALFRTAQMSYDLQFDGAAFAYSWPSGGGLASYIYDRDSAQGAERYLYEFLQMVQNETGAKSINIIAHSMGNQMLLQVLRSLKLRAPQAISKINQVILAAPDVDRDAFEAIAAEVTGIAKGITLYASANDRALEASRFVAGNKPRAGDVPEGGPVIVTGIDSIDISQLSTGYLALHHSGYAEHTDLLTDIGQIIRTGTRPWSQRLKAYRAVKVPAGTYWRYEN
jgi:esterase/lipase superfamily enzyme